tara:strand:- start:432 stop:905 length:474 start_codon:yes stop_codon:yes gene_type:complete
MGVIKPTLTLTSNASSATTDAGPLSIALSLSATDSLSVDQVVSGIKDVDGSHEILLDASDFCAGGSATAEAGTDGAFVYIKNVAAADSGRNIMIGSANSNLSDNVDPDSPSATRLFTLQPQEFAWFPWDCTYDIYEDANGSTSNALEYWVFVRTGTA